MTYSDSSALDLIKAEGKLIKLHQPTTLPSRSVPLVLLLSERFSLGLAKPAPRTQTHFKLISVTNDETHARLAQPDQHISRPADPEVKPL